MAGKRTKATDEEIFYIAMNPKGLTQQQLANKYDLSIKVVSKIQEEHRKEQEAKAEVVDKPKREDTQMRKMIANKTAAQRKGVSIFTPGAAELLDEHNKMVRQNKKKDKYNNNFTTKSYPDEE